MKADPLHANAPWDHAWTLAAPLTFTGIGLHAGLPATVRLVPAPAGHGLQFHRVDLPGSPAIPARFDHVSETLLSTTLAVGEARVQTVEHLLAALWGMGVSDARIEVDGPEIPIMDGSAAPFAQAIAEAGIVVLEAPRPFAPLPQVSVEHDDKAVSSLPSDACQVTYTVDYGHPLAGPQFYQRPISPTVFLAEIAPARTFCFMRDVEAMRKAGLAKGGSAENALVIGDDGYSSPLRYPDELVRHKVLDLLGDLALLGVFWRGHVLADKAGHDMHNRFARQLAEHLAPVPALAQS